MKDGRDAWPTDAEIGEAIAWWWGRPGIILVLVVFVLLWVLA